MGLIGVFHKQTLTPTLNYCIIFKMQDEILRVAFGQRLKMYRKKKGLTQSKLAEETYLKRTSITNIEKGKQLVSLAALYRLADALDVDVRDLLPTIPDLAETAKTLTQVRTPDRHEVAHWVSTITTDTE